MKRTHIAPYLVASFAGIVFILGFDSMLGLVLGFILTVIGVAGAVFHLTVDEHIEL